MIDLTYRIASLADVSQIAELMRVSIIENMKSFLSPAEVEAARETMGVDLTLINDKTYFVIETIQHTQKIMLGCGGWGKRKTLYGGDHTAGRDDSFSNPATDAARIRAMYTHPAWTRCGVGTLLLDISEAAARSAGYKKIELGATIAGEPFYLSRAYQEVDRVTHATANEVNSVVIIMEKDL